jgi:hypothetical protein
MFSTAWKVEDIFPGWTRTKLEDWGASDPELIGVCADIAAFKLGKALGFSNDEEEMRQAEQFFRVVFLGKQHKTERLRGKRLLLRRQCEMQLPQERQPVMPHGRLPQERQPVMRLPQGEQQMAEPPPRR